jgi:PcfJ-like protein
MSWPERSVRYHKLQVDRAIHRAYGRLAADAPAVAKFDELLHCARNRAQRLLGAPVRDESHPGVQALVNLSRFGNAHIRSVADWSGTESSWQRAVSSLAQHLLCQYEVPVFLASSWYSTKGTTSDHKRSWFVEHGRGVSFRSLDLPIELTRRMEHIFLASPDHLPIEYALRRAELLALAVPTEFVRVVLATRLATDLSNGAFWRTVWFFLIANASLIKPGEIGPMIDFFQAIRFDRVRVETPDGVTEVDPPHPTFSVKGRTVQSILRLMRDWHRSLDSGGPDCAWTPSPLQPMALDEPSRDASDPPKRWRLMELTTSAQLRAEGAALLHCVASYADRCCQGRSRIWSLRLWHGDNLHHVMTIEVDPAKRAVIQARARANSAPSGRPLRLLQDWAARERLQIAI